MKVSALSLGYVRAVIDVVTAVYINIASRANVGGIDDKPRLVFFLPREILTLRASLRTEIHPDLSTLRELLTSAPD